MLGRLQGCKKRASPRREAGRYTVTNREPNNEREQRDPAIRRNARSGNFSDPDHEFGAVILFGDRVPAASLRRLASFLQSPGDYDVLKDLYMVEEKQVEAVQQEQEQEVRDDD